MQSRSQMEFLTAAPIGVAAVAAWAPNFLVSPSVAYELSEIALLYAGFLVAWRAGAAALQDQGSAAYYAVAAGAAWVGAWPAGALFLPGSDFFRFGIVILAIAYLWAKSRISHRVAFWTCAALALILARTLTRLIL